MYKNLERYFGACVNCGSCCTIPGIFLPGQIDLLAGHLKLDKIQLFRKYLVAELFTPDIEAPPAFLISPVKSDSCGVREKNYLSVASTAKTHSAICIFRDNDSRSCRVYDRKPFGCTLLICSKMTKARPITLNKTYYYHHWLDSQGMLFSIFPGLGELYIKLLKIVVPLPRDKTRKEALVAANIVIGKEISDMMNGRPATNSLFYKTSSFVR